jgi:HPt (histidine-containing phosphotransfer) domain-containing protein
MKEHQEILIACGVDISCIEECFGDLSFYKECFGDLMATPYFSLLHDAMARGDCAAAFEAAHAIKGAAGNLRLMTLYNDDCVLVEALRGGDMGQSAAAWARVEKDWRVLESAQEEMKKL